MKIKEEEEEEGVVKSQLPTAHSHQSRRQVSAGSIGRKNRDKLWNSRGYNPNQLGTPGLLVFCRDFCFHSFSRSFRSSFCFSLSCSLASGKRFGNSNFSPLG
ncbi:hypothetical protein E2C01_016188 [Portunus trituberculatus]|uniref:Uncharacterized protein n=1 Tax=Portunus trituberculatus TaxID=210409 RepID=A0A5B7DPY3_PORTR|nr:hypothetical protein [Portunus trituberculatus]